MFLNSKVTQKKAIREHLYLYWYFLKQRESMFTNLWLLQAIDALDFIQAFI